MLRNVFLFPAFLAACLGALDPSSSVTSPFISLDILLFFPSIHSFSRWKENHLSLPQSFSFPPIAKAIFLWILLKLANTEVASCVLATARTSFSYFTQNGRYSLFPSPLPFFSWIFRRTGEKSGYPLQLLRLPGRIYPFPPNSVSITVTVSEKMGGAHRQTDGRTGRQTIKRF